MGLFTQFLKPRKPRQFNYLPIYYDADKEAREERVATLKKKYAVEKNGESSEYLPHIRGQFKARHQEKMKIRHTSNVRIVVILAVLLVIAFILIDKLPSYYFQ